MKQYLFSLLTFCCLSMNAQENYDLFPIDSVIHSSDEFEFPTVKIDSTVNVNYYLGYTYTPNFNLNYQYPFDYPIETDSLEAPNDCILWDYGHWFAKSVNRDSLGIFTCTNRMEQAFTINSQDTVGSDWILFNYENGDQLKASLDSITFEVISDFSDSVQYISLERLDNLGNSISDDINSMRIRLSKQHGIIESPAFFDFPFRKINFVYKEKIKPTYPIEQTNRYKVWNMEVGDEFHIEQTEYSEYPRRKEETITNKTWLPTEEKFIYTKSIKSEILDSVRYINMEPFFYYSYATTTETDTNNLNDYLMLDELHFGTEDIFSQGMAKGRYNDSLFYIGEQMNYFDLSMTYTPSWCQSIVALYGDLDYYIEACGGPYKQYGSADLGEAHDYILKYYKKANNEWGTPFILSNNEYVKGNIELYPNPAKDVLYISTLDYNNGSIRLIDHSGRMVLEKSLFGNQSHLELEIGHLNPGLYIVELVQQGTVVAEKIIIE